MSSVLNTSTQTTQSAKRPENSIASGRIRPAAGESAGEFGALFGEMMSIAPWQEIAAPAAAQGKPSPVAGLAAEVLGPSVHIITAAEPATSDESLRAFAKAQGMDEAALALIFGQPATASLPGNAGGLATGPAGGSLPGPATAGVPSSATGSGASAMNLIDLGPEATLRWSVGDPSQATPATSKEPVTPMFGLNGLRAMLPTPPAADAAAAAADEPAAHPEAANQSLAASLILGASEAGQAARRQQLKQALERTERLGDLAQAPRAGAPVQAAVGEILTASGAETEVPVETLTLDIGLDESEMQKLLQHRPAEGRLSDGGQNSGSQGGTSAAAQRTDLDLRAEQYEKLSQRLGEALGQRLAAQIAKGDWKVEMALRPLDLGNIDIELAMKNGGLEASFSASEARTRDLISEGLPRLKEVLAELGMDVASVNVNVRQNGQHGGNPTPGKQEAGVAGVAGKRAGAAEPVTAAAPPARSGPSQDDGLDVLV